MTLQSTISADQLQEINGHLRSLDAEHILKWGLEHLPNLFQTTAFGLTGLVQLDLLSNLSDSPPPLIFLDTLYHFPETLQLVERVQKQYGRTVHIYKPVGCETVSDFESKNGERLWERDETTYDYLVKVEPARHAYAELNVLSVITGRRASQGAARGSLQPLEIDSTGLFKLNPLYSWNFSAVNAYIQDHNVPHNALLNQGYKSVGDWHSTQKSGDGDSGERAGRWAGNAEKTECGLHEDYFKLRMEMLKKQHDCDTVPKPNIASREAAAEEARAIASQASGVLLSSQ